MTNPYFGVEPVPASTAGWTTIATLADDRGLLAAKVAATGDAVGTRDLRVAGSVDLLGVTARVLSPVLALAALDGRLPALTADRVWWKPVTPGPMRLAFDVVDAAPASGPVLLDTVVRPVLAPLLDGYRRAFAISPRVLWGNVASALNGAAAQLGSPLVDGLVLDALSVGELRGTARRLSPRFRRNSCCLLYRVPPSGVCADCVLGERRGRV